MDAGRGLRGKRDLPAGVVMLIHTLVAVASGLGALGMETPQSPRQIITLTDGWKFHKGEAAGADQPGFDDGAWTAVKVPHTWNARDGQDGGNDYYRGPAWYRLTFEVDEEWSHRRAFLRFEAASQVAEVFVNGTRVGEHRGSFGAFCFEITSLVHFDAPNLLAVKVDNARREDVPPWSADFTLFGGLYREVALILAEQSCISPLDHASRGVYAKQVKVTDDRAELAITTLLTNGVKKSGLLDLEVTVSDGVRKVVQAETSVELAGGEQRSVVLPLVIDKPHLWNGREDPFLYDLHVALHACGQVLDEVTIPIGLRYFSVDPQTGFHLNGKPYRIVGVNRHQDRIDRGWAVAWQQHAEDFELIHEMGCTGVRLAHYPQDDFVYSLCDRFGLVTWAEIPLVNRVFDTDAFAANCRTQLIELIRQHYNHPSICFWGIHNEVTAPWEPGPDPAPLVHQLAQLAHQEDPTRLTTCAACDPVDHPANWQTQVVAVNRYFGWYNGAPDELGPWLDATHAAHPNTPLGISEYGAGASIRHHEVPPNKPQHAGDWHPEEWQALVHETAWREMSRRPFVWCTFVWNMFDFASDGRSEGDTRGRNDKGLVTYDRKTCKDAFYFYKAQWTKEPFVHITSQRFTPRPAGPTPVKVYANCRSVELFVNGASQGTREAADHVFVWPQVTLNAGQNAVRAVSTDAGGVKDECVWIGKTQSANAAS